MRITLPLDAGFCSISYSPSPGSSFSPAVYTETIEDESEDIDSLPIADVQSKMAAYDVPGVVTTILDQSSGAVLEQVSNFLYSLK